MGAMHTWAEELRLQPALVTHLMATLGPVGDALAARQRRLGAPLPVALCGAQGSGKSTQCALLARYLRSEHGLRVASLSLDDLYMTRSQRGALAARVHPELATRGLPGTHDLELAARVFDGLLDPSGPAVALPAFDKARDDRVPEAAFETLEGPRDIVLFEGWCVGAAPERAEAMGEPLNAFERSRDADGALRAHVREQLAGPYAALFARFAVLIMLRAPDMESVVRWRTEQEHALAARLRAEGRDGRAMSDADVGTFVQRFERVTRHMLAEMPARADMVIELDVAHRVTGLRQRTEAG